MVDPGLFWREKSEEKIHAFDDRMAPGVLASPRRSSILGHRRDLREGSALVEILALALANVPKLSPSEFSSETCRLRGMVQKGSPDDIGYLSSHGERIERAGEAYASAVAELDAKISRLLFWSNKVEKARQKVRRLSKALDKLDKER